MPHEESGFNAALKPINGMTELERMEQGHGAIELFLCRWVARGGKMHSAELFTSRIMLMILRHDAADRQDQNRKAMNKDSRAKYTPLNAIL